jgi:hypothetical protein
MAGIVISFLDGANERVEGNLGIYPDGLYFFPIPQQR